MKYLTSETNISKNIEWRTQIYQYPIMAPVYTQKREIALHSYLAWISAASSSRLVSLPRLSERRGRLKFRLIVIQIQDLKVNLTEEKQSRAQYQSINWYRLVSIVIDYRFHRLDIPDSLCRSNGFTSLLPVFKPWRTRYESVNYGISNYWFT